MKKSALSFVTVLAVAAFSLGATSLASAQKKEAMAKARVFRGEIYDSACAKMGTHEQMKKKAGVTTDKDCTLKCAEMGSKFVLFNPATKATHELDDQDKAKEHAGEKVKVAGTLDKATNTIHVEKIEAAAMHHKMAKKKT